MSKTGNHVFYFIAAVIALLATLPEEVLAFVPAKYKPYAVAVPIVAMWLKSHFNLVAEPPK